MKARSAGLFCNFVCWAQARSRLQLHIAQAGVFHLVKLYFRYAQVPNARLGHIHASMAATLALRICPPELKFHIT